MSQSTKAALAVIFAYIVLTTMNGNLRNWLVIIGLKS